MEEEVLHGRETREGEGEGEEVEHAGHLHGPRHTHFVNNNITTDTKYH